MRLCVCVFMCSEIPITPSNHSCGVFSAAAAAVAVFTIDRLVDMHTMSSEPIHYNLM